LHELDAAESSHAQCGYHADVAQLDVSKGVVNPFIETKKNQVILNERAKKKMEKIK
jgi:hypothetical protein